ncbi:MAG: anti-sigma factor [Verrucomicrobiia bacterium]|jgi:anti-sigma-K factor RskA
MTHEAFREMLPLYVIGALDGDELYNLERYVAENRERCNAEIAEYQVIADQIALLAPPAEPSPAVYERIAAAIGEGKRPGEAPVAARVTAPVSARPPAVERREREGSGFGALIFRFVPWTAAAVLGVLLFSANGQLRVVTGQLESMTRAYNELLGKSHAQEGTLTQQQGSLADLTTRVETQAKELDQLRVRNNEQQRDLETLRAANRELTDEKDKLLQAADQMRQQLERETVQTAALQKKVDEQTGVLDLVMDPAIRVAALGDPKGETKGVGKAYWQSVKKTGLVVVSNIAPVAQSQGKCLEVWAICGNEPPVAAGIGWTDDSGHGILQVKLTKDIACIDKFAVTVERAGGVPTPEGSIILIGQ